MMPEILFLSHRIPFPPNRGDKIRSNHVLKRLVRIAPVHVATFADDDADVGQEVELASAARSYRLVRRAKPLALAGMQSLLSGKPVSLHAFYDPALEAYVQRVLRDRPIGTIFVFSGQMGQYVPRDFAGRVVVDFVDVDSVKFEDYARRGRGFVRWVNAREARLLCAVEGRIAARAAVSLLISAEEAALFTQRLEPAERGRTDVQVLPNGIDSEFFDPSGVLPEQQLESLDALRLIFTGQMDYAPNVDAVVRATERIMPLIREAYPSATFHVVGRNPAERVKALDGINGTRIWGAVDDVRPWLKAADIALVPLEIARGVQNKVLEAMSMCLPTVVTRAAATGIPAIDGTHYTIADDDLTLASAVQRLAADRNAAHEMGQAARRYVVENFGWGRALESLPEIVGIRRTAVVDAA